MEQLDINNQKGFTIIELLIATAILSTILVMSTIMMTRIGTLYYKGINQSRVQDNVRSLTDEISSQLQLSTDGFYQSAGDNITIPSEIKSYCIGKIRYTYVIDQQIGVTYPHVLWRDSVASGCGVADLRNATLSGGVELIAPNSRLTLFDLQMLGATSPYRLAIGVLYGDTNLTTGNLSTRKCAGGKDNQFCAKAELTTIVGKRL